MRVWRIPYEPDRFMVESASGGLPWTVDLHYDRQGAACSCWVEHNRTDAHRFCKHIAAVRAFLSATAPVPAAGSCSA